MCFSSSPYRTLLEEIAKRLPSAQASMLLQHMAEKRTNNQGFDDVRHSGNQAARDYWTFTRRLEGSGSLLVRS
jgi:hypothetical protein